MALSIKTEEADRLARILSKLTGETLTQAVTTALRERLDGEQARRAAAADLPTRIAAFSQRIRYAYDARPVTKTEWDAVSRRARMIVIDTSAVSPPKKPRYPRFSRSLGVDRVQPPSPRKRGEGDKRGR